MNAATISECGRYRYSLVREVRDVGPTIAYFGVNPSTADAVFDDHTVRKLRGFSSAGVGRVLHAGRFIIGNLFALRAIDVRVLAKVDDPIGPQNDEYIKSIAAEADILVPFWGSLDKLPKALRPRANAVIKLLQVTGKPLMCWGLTKSGDPKHPLMLGYDTPLQDFPLRLYL